MEKYINNKGEVGVLVADDLAGWSTSSIHREFFAMDRGLVELKIAKSGENEVREYLKRSGIANPNTRGWSGCVVKYLPKGTAFRITKLGFEKIETAADLNLTA